MGRKSPTRAVKITHALSTERGRLDPKNVPLYLGDKKTGKPKEGIEEKQPFRGKTSGRGLGRLVNAANGGGEYSGTPSRVPRNSKLCGKGD